MVTEIYLGWKDFVDIWQRQRYQTNLKKDMSKTAPNEQLEYMTDDWMENNSLDSSL